MKILLQILTMQCLALAEQSGNHTILICLNNQNGANIYWHVNNLALSSLLLKYHIQYIHVTNFSYIFATENSDLDWNIVQKYLERSETKALYPGTKTKPAALSSCRHIVLFL